MKQRFLILFFLFLVIAVLVGLNAVSYTKTEKTPDTELFPNRSSYNSGTTGSSAFYSLLTETGNRVVRWQQPPSALLSAANSKIKTFVLIGATRKEMTDEEADKIMLWVSKGGRLVVIDRFPHSALLKPEGNWQLSSAMPPNANLHIDPAVPVSLFDKIPAAKPVQPTALMSEINSVQPSKLAAGILIKYLDKTGEKNENAVTPTNKIPGRPTKLLAQPKRLDETPPPPPAKAVPGSSTPKVVSRVEGRAADGSGGTGNGSGIAVTKPVQKAPFVHLSNSEKDLLAEFNYGSGRVVFLSDPFIVSNAGIKLVDNSTLAVNMVAVQDGTIAFDEYHQGYGSENTFLRYFAGTPVPALLAQGALLIFILLWTQGRRFARPLPMPAKDRRSKLEYVAAMADLQQNTRAYDLAIENVYTQTKRSLVRLVGADNTIPRKQLAEAVAERTKYDAKSLYLLMAKCEDIIQGEPTNAKETMNLISQLRELEEKFGFRRNKSSGLK